MASATPDRQPIRRLSIATNVLLQVGAAFLFLCVINYLSARHNWRWDLSRGRNFTLSEQTQNYVRNLHGKTEIVAVFPRNSAEDKEVRLLLDEYKRLGKSHLALEYLDLAQESDRRLAAERKYGVALKENGLIVSREVPPPKAKAGEAASTDRVRRTKFIPATALFRYEEQAGQMRMAEFFGEDQLTSAVINVNQKASPVVYLLTASIGSLPNAGTPESPQTAQNVLYDMCAKQDLAFRGLDLTGLSEIPDDASALICLRPGRDFTEREIGLLQAYWKEKKGAGFVFLLDPATETPRLDAFLGANGVAPRPDRVMNVIRNGLRGTSEPQFMVSAGYNPDSEIARPFGTQGTLFTEQSRSLALEKDANKLRDAMVDVTAIAVAAPDYWGETRFEDPLPRYDEGVDAGVPIVLAASVERGAQKDQRLGSTSSRMVVFGNAALIDPQPENPRQVPNYDLVSASLNWVLNREELIGVSSRLVTNYHISLSPANTTKIFWICLGLLPASVLMFALFMWSARRA